MKHICAPLTAQAYAVLLTHNRQRSRQSGPTVILVVHGDRPFAVHSSIRSLVRATWSRSLAGSTPRNRAVLGMIYDRVNNNASGGLLTRLEFENWSHIRCCRIAGDLVGKSRAPQRQRDKTCACCALSHHPHVKAPHDGQSHAVLACSVL
jgi:hypothetical protein